MITSKPLNLYTCLIFFSATQIILLKCTELSFKREVHCQYLFANGVNFRVCSTMTAIFLSSTKLRLQIGPLSSKSAKNINGLKNMSNQWWYIESLKLFHIVFCYRNTKKKSKLKLVNSPNCYKLFSWALSQKSPRSYGRCSKEFCLVFTTFLFKCFSIYHHFKMIPIEEHGKLLFMFASVNVKRRHWYLYYPELACINIMNVYDIMSNAWHKYRATRSHHIRLKGAQNTIYWFNEWDTNAI